MVPPMGRFEPTGTVEVPGLGHRSVEPPWGVLRGAFGPSDGSAGARANVPSALSVLRHAPLYAALPAEIEEAFTVLEHHPLRHRVLYPVAVAIAPYLFDVVRRGSPLSPRITELVAEYVACSATLEPHLRHQLRQLVADHAGEVIGWIGRHDRPVAALAIHVPALRAPYLAALDAATSIFPFALLALLELGHASPPVRRLALAVLDDAGAAPTTRAAAAAFLARFGDGSPALRERIDAALPPSAPAALANLVTRLWSPQIERPVVAPKLHDAEVVFAGERLVLVRAGAHSVTLPWQAAPVQRGDVIQVGITAHGQPKLVVVNEPDGGVRVIDF